MRNIASIHRTPDHTEAYCLLCGAPVIVSVERQADVICLICRAAILDRVFQARRQREQPEDGNGMPQLRWGT